MQTILFKIDLARPTIIDAIILLGAVCAVVSSIHFSPLYPSKELFERSGSLVVLLAGIVEFRNLNLQQCINDKAAISYGGIAGVLTPTKQPPIRQFVIITSHIFIIVGTLIWGYGGVCTA